MVPIRKNTSNQNKHLSDLAINNIINYYKDSDYKALKKLFEYKFISKELLESYYKYKYNNK